MIVDIIGNTIQYGLIGLIGYGVYKHRQQPKKTESHEPKKVLIRSYYRTAR